MKVLMKPVEMIAFFMEDGKPAPLRFRFKQDGGYITVKVGRAYSPEEEKIAGNRMYVYRCRSLINGIEKMYELKYELNTCKWYLFKM